MPSSFVLVIFGRVVLRVEETSTYSLVSAMYYTPQANSKHRLGFLLQVGQDSNCDRRGGVCYHCATATLRLVGIASI